MTTNQPDRERIEQLFRAASLCIKSPAGVMAFMATIMK